MKVRIKFEKDGVMRYIGHLDIMRFFQKAIRRAEIDIKYSSGFSPHQIMSFAAPLGVGHISTGEYFDIEINSHNGNQAMLEALNDAMVPGIRVTSVKGLPDTAGNAMASVAAARYFVNLKESTKVSYSFKDSENTFMSCQEILVKKQTKKQELTMDIKPHIYEWIPSDKGIEMLLDASSSGNIKPLLAIEAYCNFINAPYDALDYQITRMETYLNKGTENAPEFAPLDSVGEDF